MDKLIVFFVLAFSV